MPGQNHKVLVPDTKLYGLGESQTKNYQLLQAKINCFFSDTKIHLMKARPRSTDRVDITHVPPHSHSEFFFNY
jgi:hypothetical protein